MKTLTLTQLNPSPLRMYLRPTDLEDCNIPIGEWSHFFTASTTPGDNANCVNEVTLDTNTYVSAESYDAQYDLYKLENSTSTDSTINYVKVHTFAKSRTYIHPYLDYKILIDPEGLCDSYYESDAKNLTTTWGRLTNVWETDPSTGTDWTWDTINTLGIGMYAHNEAGMFARETVTLRPSADSSVEHDRNDGGANYSCVDEEVKDDDTTYIYNDEAATTKEDYFNVSVPTDYASFPIEKISIHMWVKNTGASTAAVACGLARNDEFQSGGSGWHAKAPAADYSKVNGVPITYCPWTSFQWQWSDLADLQAWVSTAVSNSDCRITQVYIVVTYLKPVVDAPQFVKEITLRPDADTTRIGSAWQYYRNAASPYLCLNQDQPADDYYLENISTPGAWRYEFVTAPSMPTTTYAIKSVTFVASVRGNDASYDRKFELRFKGNAVSYGQKITVRSNKYTTISWKLKNDPDTGNPWTIGKVNALEFGIGTYSSKVRCSQLYLVVEYTETSGWSAIDVAQVYAEIGYTPNTITCTLASPTEISCNHARNVNKINFWNGEREVYGINRSGKSLTLRGTEYYEFRDNPKPCDRIICVRNMARRGDEVTLSDLSPNYFNGTYHIREFGWNLVSSAPTVYEWILNLEDAEK